VQLAGNSLKSTRVVFVSKKNVTEASARKAAQGFPRPTIPGRLSLSIVGLSLYGPRLWVRRTRVMAPPGCNVTYTSKQAVTSSGRSAPESSRLRIFFEFCFSTFRLEKILSPCLENILLPMTAQMTPKYFRSKFRVQKNIHFRSECLNKVFHFCEVYTDKPVVTFHTFGK